MMSDGDQAGWLVDCAHATGALDAVSGEHVAQKTHLGSAQGPDPAAQLVTMLST